MADYLLVLGVIIAAIAAGAAWKAAKESQKTSLAHFILEDRGTYGSPEMLEAMMELIHWWHEDGNTAQEFGRLKNSRNRKEYEKVKDVDEARRRFSYYFTLTKVLLEHDLIDEELAEELRPEGLDKFHLEFVEPLRKEIKTATDKESLKKKEKKGKKTRTKPKEERNK